MPSEDSKINTKSSTKTFLQKLEAKWNENRFVCVGLDSDYAQIPQLLKDKFGGNVEEVMFDFNRKIIDSTADLVGAYKPNSAFYEAEGDAGSRALKRTVRYIKEDYPQVPVILDAKRGDIGNTNLGYIKSAFDDIGADAVTVHPYLGKESLKSFLDRKDKGIIVLVRTSNKGSDEFQDVPVVGRDGKTLLYYQFVARQVAENWNENGNCAVVVGATYPGELAEVRKIVGNMPILVPGVGAQGGKVEDVVRFGRGKDSFGMIISSSRGIIFASLANESRRAGKGEDFAEAARAETIKLNQEIEAAAKL